MKWASKIILYLLVYFVNNSSLAQSLSKPAHEDKYRSVHWDVEDGLAFGKTFCMLKDVNGFLWIGTEQGLSRFDGSTFKNFYYSPGKKESIAGNIVMGLVEDSLHNIWIGTDKGLSRYDIKADTFTNFKPKHITTTLSSYIVPFSATGDKIYCQETDSLITCFDVHSFKSSVVARLTPEDQLPWANPYVKQYSFFDAASNAVWMLKDCRESERGLLQISLSTGERRHFGWPGYLDKSRECHFSEGMRYDRKRNSLWLNSEDGLIEFNLTDKQFHRSTVLDSLRKLNNYSKGVGIHLDSSGRIWASTYPKGIIIYDPSTKTVEIPFPNNDKHQSEISAHNGVVYCDPQGIVWSGKWLRKGIDQIVSLSRPVSSFLADSIRNDFLKYIVLNCIKAGNGKVWMGTANDGIIQFDPKENRIENYLPKEDIHSSMKEGMHVIPVMVDTNLRKAVIRINDNSLYELDMGSKKVQPITFSAYSIAEAKPSKIFSCNPFRNGCIVNAEFEDKAGIFWLENGSLKASLIMSFPKTSIDGDRTATDGNSLLFFKRPEALGNLTYRFRNNQWTRILPHWTVFPGNKIFYNDADSSWWVIIPRELLHFDKKLRLTRRFSQQDGLPLLEIIDIINDNDGNTWFNTNRNIYRLNIKPGIISGLTEKDGFLPHDFRAGGFGAMKFDNGDLYFPGRGTAQGFQVVHPDKYKLQPAAVYLKSIDIKDYSFPVALGVNNIEQLTLKYFQNRVMIETGTIDYYSKGKGHIRYRLTRDENQENWVMAPANYTIRYEELPAGEYALQIQAGNEGGEFTGPVKTLMITIRPAFWNTWWFRVLAIVIVLVLLFGIIQYRSRYLKERNLVLEEKVTHRTNELNNSLAELKTTQDQLIQSEKMASLGELTSGIAHEIKNPLNFINNFSEINMELISELEEEEINNPDENYRAHIGQIIKTLKKNSEKINHHGKRVDGIVKGMLQHSRLGNTNKEPVNINSVCDESLKLAWHSFKAKEKTFNASFETRFDPDLPQIKVFAQDFGRVMINLINNAFYAVHEKKKRNQSDSSPDMLQAESLYKPSVIVSTKKNGNKILITVSDNGMGIPSPIMNKIFQPFFTTKPTGEGTGLGLSMSYDIISKSHGGEIRAKSKEGLGTDIEIILPV